MRGFVAGLLLWGACLGQPTLAQAAAAPDYSQPLTLAQCLAVALANHPAVKAAEATLAAATQRVVESKAPRYPSLTLDSGWSRFQSSRQGFAVGSAGASENRETGVGLSYLFVDSGEREVAIRQSVATAAGQEASVTVTRQDLALTVVDAYYELLTAQKLETLQEAVVTSAQQHVAAAEAGVEAGTAAKIDVLRAQTELANARVDLIAAEGAIRRARATLRNALGEPEAVDLTVAEEQPLPQPEIELAQAQGEALTKRSELQQREAELQSTQESLRSARIKAGPVFSMTGGYDQYLESTRNVTSEWVLRAGLSYPLFDGKQSRARVRAAEANLRAQQEQRERERQQILLEVERALITVTDAAARQQAAEAAQQQAQENLALNEAAYAEGVASMTEVIDARAAAAKAATSQIQALYEFNRAVRTLRHALGRELVEEGAEQ